VQALSSESSSSDEDCVNATRPTQKFSKYDGTFVRETSYSQFHNEQHGKRHANADELSRQPMKMAESMILQVTDDHQIQSARTQVKSETPSVTNDRRIQSIRVLTLVDDSDLTRAELVNADAMSASVKEISRQYQFDVAGQPTTPSATDDRPSSAPTNRLRPKVRNVNAEVVCLLVGENLTDDQCSDAELGRVVHLRSDTDERLMSYGSIPTDLEVSRKKWDSLEVQDVMVYRRLDSPEPSTPTMSQLLIPRCSVPEVLRLCHTGTVGGHFGVKRTVVREQRRTYSANWKTIMREYCEFSRQGRLNQVYSAVNIPYSSSDEADAPTIDYGDFVVQFCSGLTALREVKPFTGTPPTRWIVRSSGTADVSDVPDPHADAAETEETKSAGPRLRRRLESEPTSPST